MCTVSVSSPDSPYYENWPGPSPISRLCFYRNGTLARCLLWLILFVCLQSCKDARKKLQRESLLIKSDLKWCIHLSRSLFFIFMYPLGFQPVSLTSYADALTARPQQLVTNCVLSPTLYSYVLHIYSTVDFGLFPWGLTISKYFGIKCYENVIL